MDHTQLIAVISGLVGLLIGVGGVLAYNASQRGRVLQLADDTPDLPEGAADVLGVIGRAYVLVDEVDGVVRANPSAYAYGLVRGHTLVHSDIVEMIADVRRDGVVREGEFELPRGPVGQGFIVVHVRMAPLGGEHILILADDRTEITRTATMRRDFVANVSHELKTPVGAVGLLAEAIESAADDEVAVRRFTKRLAKESQRLAALVQDIIELSRLQSADVVQAGEEVDMSKLVNEAVDRTALIAGEQDIEIKVGGIQNATVYGESDLLMTAVRNLIDNAIRYSPEGTTVGVGISDRNGLVSVTVTDQGPGIPADEQERVFERFYRLDSARARSTGGSGLGLSIVRHVMESHGGEVTLWSQPGQGSTFTLRLPRLESEEEQSASSASSSLEEASSVEGK
ncbi:sensor histidine kinase [Pseudoglutamicibacter albus]|uniref:Sensor-like histidine kinase SenX3 n=1 Tax=Pseudoglutamicibacter albus TaxID=98671 RepID=A0ABU1YX84_9MICC|nr:ATP-binding protein [Pseudoglutamicibacter albus]MDR7292964.1 two-component system sensor histidine kinase SenX3 [Pseudoglutamicibacter albus]